MDFQKRFQTQIKWLLQGDVVIRYQTKRDLIETTVKKLAKEQNKILKQGWGRELMRLQDRNGTWSNSLYSPKWTSTFYTLLLLKIFNAKPDKNIKKACKILLDSGFYAPDGGINYWKSWKCGECCVTGMLLGMLCFFGIEDERIDLMVKYLISQQMSDYGFNCNRPRGAVHSSFHTTISVLEGLWEYEKVFPRSALIKSVRQMQDEGIEFLLQHRLYKSDKSGKIVHPQMVKLAFPPRWHYDILRCLDYFQDKGIKKEKRMVDAVCLLKEKQTKDGFWKLETKYRAKVFFDMEKVGKASRWNTLRVLRVLKWWN